MFTTFQPQPINWAANLARTMKVVETKIDQMGGLQGKKITPSNGLTRAVQIFEHSWFEILVKEQGCPKTAETSVLTKAVSLLRAIPRSFRIVEKNASVGIIGRLFWSIVGFFTGTKYIYIEAKNLDVEKFLKNIRTLA